MYKSHIDGRDLIPQRYIVELVCLKLAKIKNEKLEYGFWNTESWKSYYKFQIRLSYQLTQIYPHEAIVKTLKTDCHIYTLRDTKLDGLIKKFLNEKEIKPIEVKKFGENKPKRPTLE